MYGVVLQFPKMKVAVVTRDGRVAEIRTLAPALELRYQNVVISGEPNPSLLTFGLQLSF